MLKTKQGLSLIVLVIIVVATITLLSIGIVELDKNIELSSISSFSNDIKDVEDTASAYLIENGMDSLETITLDEIVELMNADSIDAFTEEVTLNLDQDEEIFYMIDLPKVGVKKSVRGYSENGVDDVYVLASNSFHAYYLKGIKVKGVTYFSISNKIKNLVNQT